jgi:TonB-dependent SusC/RagA subfamily outer membrane receptor
MKIKYLFILVVLIFTSKVISGQKSGTASDKMVTISGKVMNQNRIPVSGAVFYIDNVRTSYKTGSNGSYRIKVSPEARKLEVRSSVYGSLDTLINAQKKINFTFGGPADENDLQPGIKGVSGNSPEQTGMPGKQRANKMNTYNDIYQMIRSEVPGVVVSGKRLQIRQGHSFLGSGDPLLVVNGVIVTSIDYIYPRDVKSIEVLKGTAASIYGLQGTNGVIKITLLNGSEEVK